MSCLDALIALRRQYLSSGLVMLCREEMSCPVPSSAYTESAWYSVDCLVSLQQREVFPGEYRATLSQLSSPRIVLAMSPSYERRHHLQERLWTFGIASRRYSGPRWIGLNLVKDLGLAMSPKIGRGLVLR